VSEFDRVISEHQALVFRNRRLDETMPLERYRDETSIPAGHLFGSEEDARPEATHGPWPMREHAPVLEPVDSLWADDPSFDWGD
jgi:hypothetical protein